VEEVGQLLKAGLEGVVQRGKAERGEKTMVDALGPAVEALQAAVAEGRDGAEALREAATAAEGGAEATVPMVARKGRASYLGERSAGHKDPGATSSALLVRTLAETLGRG
jgi:dihydroxyacetone kinase-like protein